MNVFRGLYSNKERVVVLLFVLCFTGGMGGVSAFYYFWRNFITPTTGIVASINLGIYGDAQCAVKVNMIDWGVIYPSSTVTQTIYLRNEGNLDVTLALSSFAWEPRNVTNYIVLSWNYVNGTICKANSISPIVLSLAVTNPPVSISTFKFNIVITATDGVVS